VVEGDGPQGGGSEVSSKKGPCYRNRSVQLTPEHDATFTHLLKKKKRDRKMTGNKKVPAQGEKKDQRYLCRVGKLDRTYYWSTTKEEETGPKKLSLSGAVRREKYGIQ